MTETDLKRHVEALIREMIADGATWADERWGILGDLMEDMGASQWVGYCRAHTNPNCDVCTHDIPFVESAIAEWWRDGTLWETIRLRGEYYRRVNSD